MDWSDEEIYKLMNETQEALFTNVKNGRVITCRMIKTAIRELRKFKVPTPRPYYVEIEEPIEKFDFFD